MSDIVFFRKWGWRTVGAGFVVFGLVIGSAGTASVFVAHGLEHSGVGLFIDPASKTITVGDTFTATIYVDTGGESVNAIEANLEFPPDKLQVVSPTAGKSLVRVWIAQPTYDNSRGTLRFEGVIPNPGINTNAGVISQVTFRATGIGSAVFRFTGNSKVLLNDGKGTNILGQTTNGLYRLTLPPPGGPAVVSPTHPDQEKWYANRSAALQWTTNAPVQGYSYTISDGPVEIPDDIPEGDKTDQTYRNLSDGIHYFHIKALRDGLWGGVTHYAIRIDATPPADYPLDITPSSRTTTHRPSIHFDTTDSHSGIDHFEIRIIPLDPQTPGQSGGEPQSFFVEATSPYVPQLDFGRYDVVVRAFDKAGNYAQKGARLTITTYALDILRDEGVQVRSNLVIPWIWIFLAAALLILLLGAAAWSHWRRHHEASARLGSRELPPDVQRQLEELRALKDRYKQVAMLLLVAGYAAMLGFASPARAEDIRLAPPVTTLVSKDISNEDIFYVGGKAEAVGGEVVVYLQNLNDGATFQETVLVEKDGSWFYSHPSFLSSGSYLIWAQLRVGGVSSPPGPQIQLTVQPTALQIGATRLSYEAIYGSISAILLVIILGLAAFLLYHRRAANRKHERLSRELQEVESSLRRSFAVLHRDIEREFAILQKAKLGRPLSDRERAVEERINRDLQTVKRYIGEELLELERDI